MGLAELIAEEVRASRPGSDVGAGLGSDDRYWRSFTYAWRLRIGEEEIDFPMVLNPTRYHESHPFAVSLTPTQGGTVYVENNGIVMSDLTIEGHTGVKPRVDSELGVPLSGQAHFLRLQRQCFERYSEEKKNHQRHEEVELTFHNFKDNKHYIVEPIKLDFPREVGRKLHYPYTIEMKIVGRIEDKVVVNEDDDVLKGYRDALGMVAIAVAGMEGFLEDTANMLAALDEVVGIATDLNVNIRSMIGAANELLRRTKRTITLPYTFVQTLLDDVDLVCETLNNSGRAVIDVVQTYRQLGDDLARLAAFPDLFVASATNIFSEVAERAGGPATQSVDKLDASANQRVSALEGYQNTDTRPGDRSRVEGRVYQVLSDYPRYEGFREVIIRVDDTLESIAARELNDARRWIDLAIVNRLKPPYISLEGLPGSLRPGSRINVPFETRQVEATAKTAGGGDPEVKKLQYDVVLGTDLKVEFSADGFADLVIAPSGTDFATVAGIDNLRQALTTITSTEQGTDLLFRNFGLPKLVGKRGTIDRLVNAQINLRTALTRDSRIVRLRDLQLILNGDTLSIEVDVVLIDGTNTRVVSRVL